MKIAIVGAGIAGLALANSLKDSSFEIHLIDSAKTLKPIGAGFTLQPNGVEVLNKVLPQGVGLETAAVINTSEIYDFAGQKLPIDIMGRLTGGGQSYSIHRGDIHAALLDNLDTNVILKTGCKVEAIDKQPESDNMYIIYSSGECEFFDVIVGADGIKSRVRDYVSPNSTLGFGHGIAVRTLVERRAEDATYENFQAWMGRGKVVLAYPVRGGEYLNLACYLPSSGSKNHSWSEPVDLAWLREQFRHADERLQDLIGRSKDAFSWNLAELGRLSTWHRDSAVLIGDAAHAMLPYLGQGANQSLVDADHLAKCLLEIDQNCAYSDVFGKYEQARANIASRYQDSSRKVGTIFKQDYGGDLKLKAQYIESMISGGSGNTNHAKQGETDG